MSDEDAIEGQKISLPFDDIQNHVYQNENFHGS